MIKTLVIPLHLSTYNTNGVFYAEDYIGYWSEEDLPEGTQVIQQEYPVFGNTLGLKFDIIPAQMYGASYFYISESTARRAGIY